MQLGGGKDGGMQLASSEEQLASSEEQSAWK